jgi:O-antigen/teichoic acid export membrane protein
LFAVNAIFSAVSTTFTNALFAIGRPKTVLNFMIFWTTATWILTYPLVVKFGYIGVGLASALVAVTSIGTIYFIKKEVPISVGKNIFGPFFVALIMFVVVRGLCNTLVSNILGLISVIIIGIFVYFVLSFGIFKRNLIEDAKIIISSLVFRR